MLLLPVKKMQICWTI